MGDVQTDGTSVLQLRAKAAQLRCSLMDARSSRVEAIPGGEEVMKYNRRIDAKDVASQLRERLNQVIPALLPNAVRRHGYWFVGSIDGEPGNSLFIGASAENAGKWKDGATLDQGHVIELIMAVRRCTFREALEWSVEILGNCDLRRRFSRSARPPNSETLRISWARRVWFERKPLDLIGPYLHGRGLRIPVGAGDLAAHEICYHGPTGMHFPAMIALMRCVRTNEPTGVHRTFLALDRRGKADVVDQKMMLGRARGACVKLCDDAEVTSVLGISEGIENAIAAQSLGFRPMWATLSAGSMAEFPVLSGVECLHIFADRDGPGEGAAAACCARWVEAGREVVVRRPRGAAGTDLNDALRERAIEWR